MADPVLSPEAFGGIMLRRRAVEAPHQVAGGTPWPGV